jgi:cob(I)alamin adenosyltransferase
MSEGARIYTGTGDHGETSLFSGQRVSKASLRVDAYGTIDELNAHLGLARSFCSSDVLCRSILKVQELLSPVMTELATVGGEPCVSQQYIKLIEEETDALCERHGRLKAFVTPGASPASAALHVSRTVARRAERLVCQLAQQEDVREDLAVFLNRLSDLLFMMALCAGKEASDDE